MKLSNSFTLSVFGLLILAILGLLILAILGWRGADVKINDYIKGEK